MTNVQGANRRSSPDWPYSEAQMRQVTAVNREAYPPAQRDGFGAVPRVAR